MGTPKLSDLRAPPEVGRFYLVPAVEYIWLERMDWWPVAGPLHSDDDFFAFPHRHYHVDPRFFTAAQERAALSNAHFWEGNRSLEEACGRWPLVRRGEPLPKGRPALIRRKCRRSERETYAFSDMPGPRKLNLHFCGRKKAAEPIRLADGRLLCPHRKYDLSQHTPGPDGIVVCPLHGLRVRCGKRKAAS